MARRIPESPAGQTQPAGRDRSRRRPPELALDEALDRALAHWQSAGQHTDQTLARMSETVRRFQHRLVATGVGTIGAVTLADAAGFVQARTRDGREPELATQHGRRTAVRTLYRTLRALGLDDHDPTLDLVLPPRGSTPCRPLSDDEVVLCRVSAQVGVAARRSTRYVVWALGEAGAVGSEISTLRVEDLDDASEPASVRLPGTCRQEPRTGVLTPWARLMLASRVRELQQAGGGAGTLLAYGGQAPPGSDKAQSAACTALRQVLNRAGLAAEPDVRPSSLRNWVGRSLYEAGAPLQQVALALGYRSLDAAAEDIALTWRAGR